jgi:hypothetical protein
MYGLARVRWNINVDRKVLVLNSEIWEELEQSRAQAICVRGTADEFAVGTAVPLYVSFVSLSVYKDRFCGLEVGVPGYRSRRMGSIPGATRFSEK